MADALIACDVVVSTDARALARARVLRGGWLDPLGHTRERREDRAALKVYRRILDNLIEQLDTSDIDVALQLVSLPEQIRGYGPVRRKTIEEAERKGESLLMQLLIT